MVKKGSKGKSAKKKGKGNENQMSFREVIIAYRITMTEQEVDDLRFEVRKMQQRNQNLVSRNEHLLDEQAALTAQCLEKAREWRRNTDKPEKLGHDSVVEVLLEMWKLRDKEETDLSAIHEAIIATEVETNRLQVDVNEWKDYQNYGKAAQAEQIELLEREKLDNLSMFEEKKAFLTRDLNTTRDTVLRNTENSVEKEKVKAAEKAMGVLQLGGRVELEDSRFLRSELNIHHEEHAKLQAEISELEAKNLEILSILFDCKVEDIRFSKSIFNSLFKEDEMLDEDDNYYMQTDISEFQYFEEEDEDTEEESFEQDAGGQEREVAEGEAEEPPVRMIVPVRPVSATMRSVQKKLQDTARMVSIAVSTDLPAEDIDQEAELKGLDSLDINDKFVMETIPEYDPYMDYVTVGPIEAKLLAITGKKMPLVKRSKSELEALGINMEDVDSQGFFHWPENLNSSKLTPMVAPADKQSQVPFTGKLMMKDNALTKQAVMTPVESIESKHRPSVLASPFLRTPSIGSASSRPPASAVPPASPAPDAS